MGRRQTGTEGDKTGEIVVDTSGLIGDEEFFYANCILLKSGEVLGYSPKNGRIEIDPGVSFDGSDLTDLMQMFRVDVDGSSYVGGEGSAHGSCGFFYKKTGDGVDWALISQESNPFIGVEFEGSKARFLSSSGAEWVVPEDDITRVYTEKC